MQFDHERPRLGHRGSVSSRAKDVLLKTVAVIGGGIALAGAFVLSLAFFAIAFAAILIVGGYLWWKTRAIRKQVRASMQDQMQQSQPPDDIIEGVVISRQHTDEHRRH